MKGGNKMAKKTRQKTRNSSGIIAMISVAVLIVIVSGIYFSSNKPKVLGSPVTGPTGCSEDDGGKNFYQYGIVKVGLGNSYPDKCMSRSGGFYPTYNAVSQCSGSNCILRETFCASSTTGAYIDKTCACSGGKCV